MTRQRTTEHAEREATDLNSADRPVVTSEEMRTVTTDPYDRRRDVAWRAQQFVWLIFGVGIALIAIRFLLLLLGANQQAGFTDLVYRVTNPLVAPFEGVFGAPAVDTGVFDPASLVAIVVYSLIVWIIVKLIRIVLGENRTAVRSSGRSIEARR